MMKKFHLIALFQFILFTTFSQSFLQVDGKKIVNEGGEEIILKGMGLGGWMLQEGYMIKTADFAPTQHEFRQKIEELIGEEATNAFYDAWLANHVRKIDIDSLAAWGFNCVRLPMHYNLYTLPIEDEPIAGENTWLSKGFELTDNLLSWCSDNEMYLILDLHAAPGGQGYDEAISDYDPSKPSLWESQLNRDKTVALWKKLAERYADEKWIAGYDLINETNWNMTDNIPLRELYVEITDSIRSVDQNHIIFIEGNWFANDFTGLTPPWDSHLVYSFHKYWSYNNEAAIKWVLDIRDNYNVPLWLGESGENSNTWFRDCISLMNTYGIGWAWWPMKKIDDIAGPLSIIRTDEYQQLLDYWNGNGSKPTAEFASSALMQMAENVKFENCRYQKDVIHAMFTQTLKDETFPYTKSVVPGIIYATDFDIGRNGTAYFDRDVANYHVSSGNYTAWNNGWVYRNDGVDIQTSEDNILTNGYNIGWIESGEWLNYTIQVEQRGYYDVSIRVAAEGNSGGSFHFESKGIPIGESINVPSTGGWQNWISVHARNIFLEQGKNTLKFVCDIAGFNLGSFDFNFKYEDPTGLDDAIHTTELRIYPNPISDVLHIYFDKNRMAKSYTLINSKGQIVKHKNIRLLSETYTSINCHELPNGLYLLNLDFGDSHQSFKIILGKK